MIGGINMGQFRITGLPTGTLDSDAVNVNQLYNTVNTAVTGLIS